MGFSGFGYPRVVLQEDSAVVPIPGEYQTALPPSKLRELGGGGGQPGVGGGIRERAGCGDDHLVWRGAGECYFPFRLFGESLLS